MLSLYSILNNTCDETENRYCNSTSIDEYPYTCGNSRWYGDADNTTYTDNSTQGEIKVKVQVTASN